MTINFDSASIIPSIVDAGELFVISMGVSESAGDTWDKYELTPPAIFDTGLIRDINNLSATAVRYKITGMQATNAGAIHIDSAVSRLAKNLLVNDIFDDTNIDPTGNDVTMDGAILKCLSITTSNQNSSKTAPASAYSNAAAGWTNPEYAYVSLESQVAAISLAARNVTYPITYLGFALGIPTDLPGNLTSLTANFTYWLSTGATGVTVLCEILRNGVVVASATDTTNPTTRTTKAVVYNAAGITASDVNSGVYTTRITVSRSTTKLSTLSLDYVWMRADYSEIGSVSLHNSKMDATPASKGAFIEAVTAPTGTYPDNGMQDGYWYTKQGLTMFTWNKYNAIATTTQSTSGMLEVYDTDFIFYFAASALTPLTTGKMQVSSGSMIVASYLADGDYFCESVFSMPTLPLIVNTVQKVTSWNQIDRTTWDYWYDNYVSVVTPDSFVGTVTGLAGAYPDNGPGSDGYYYIIQ